MAALTFDALRRFLAQHDGRSLRTLRQKKEFWVRLEGAGVSFVVTATGSPRYQPWGQVEAFLEHFNRVRSFSPGDYVDVSRNASYLLAVIKRAIE